MTKLDELREVIDSISTEEKLKFGIACAFAATIGTVTAPIFSVVGAAVSIVPVLGGIVGYGLSIVSLATTALATCVGYHRIAEPVISMGKVAQGKLNDLKEKIIEKDILNFSR